MKNVLRDIGCDETIRERIRMTVVPVKVVLRIWRARIIIWNDVGQQMEAHALVPQLFQHLGKKLQIIMLPKHVVPQDDMELAVRILPRGLISCLQYDIEKQPNVLTG